MLAKGRALSMDLPRPRTAMAGWKLESFLVHTYSIPTWSASFIGTCTLATQFGT